MEFSNLKQSLKNNKLIQDINCRRPGPNPEVDVELARELREGVTELQISGYWIRWKDHEHSLPKSMLGETSAFSFACLARK
jgi:hypothetical protein